MYVSIPKVAKPNRSSCDGCDRRWKSVQGECFFLMIRTHKWIICWYTIIYILWYNVYIQYHHDSNKPASKHEMRLFRNLAKTWESLRPIHQVWRDDALVRFCCVPFDQPPPGLPGSPGSCWATWASLVAPSPFEAATVETSFSWDDMMISYHSVHLEWL